LTENKIAQLDSETNDFTPAERLAVEYAGRMATDHHNIDDNFFARLHEHFSDAQIVELGMMIGQFIGFGRLLMVLDLVTHMVPGLMSQMPIPESSSSRDSDSGATMPNIMSWFMNAWTASKARTYEQVRLKTFLFQLKELYRV